ncbi:type II toxin-antitoxin system PemK/MazF family toxin [Streptomyces sp. H27-D2]|uniref:type II toxin-antitoxin system PemK/MazF family toxin n=1 Tax=Streptomyces sp. H27-D2 TaxID=3046304 RepID=UPI002DBBB45D|nr:type II toxin-antitoxin system PemK/MazF family toxin [Streptomyces sp. H27-D2]MEC4017228.1 type II toxin-antitoxin system PemK/MazF family toxin [Streptomyces sp. H27-D2]
MNVRTALRGEVWKCALPSPLGPHPVVVLSANRIAERLSSLTVAVITGTAGPRATHVTISRDAGVTKYDESHVNCTDLHTVSKSRLSRHLGRLSPGELSHMEECVRLILGLT